MDIKTNFNRLLRYKNELLMKIFFYIMLSALLSNSSEAQNAKKEVDQINQLMQQYNEVFLNTKIIVDSLLQKTVPNPKLWESFFAQPLTNQKSTTTEAATDNSTAASLPIGLKWTSDATYNFSPGIAENEDVFFRSRIATGLDWAIVGEGSRQSKKEDYKRFNLQKNRDAIQDRIQNNESNVLNKQQLVAYLFDAQRLSLLKNYQKVLQMQSDFQNQMYLNTLSNKATLLKAEGNEQEVVDKINLLQMDPPDQSLKELTKQYKYLPNETADLPSPDKIDLEKVTKEKQRLLYLQNELRNSNQYSSERPSLKAKVRYNYYESENQQGRGFASVGASFSMPVFKGKDKEIKAYQNKSDQDQLYFEQLKAKEELKIMYKTFYLMKNKIAGLERDFKYNTALLDNEMEIYKSERKNFSPAKYVTLADNLVQNRLEYLDRKQQLCEIYLDFLTRSGAEVSPKVNGDEQEIVETTYMWKAAFEAASNSELISKLVLNNIKTLFLSPGNNDVKIKEFLEQAREQNIEVYRLVGENSFAKNEQGIAKLSQKLAEIQEYDYAGVHLDVEPQTFDDYKTRKEFYELRMNEIYSTTQQWAQQNNLKCSVSVPMSLPIGNATFLTQNNITAYIMAYEETEQSRLLKRTEKLREALQDNFVWVLRLTDFSTTEMLQEAQENLKAAGVTNIAYYDFSAL